MSYRPNNRWRGSNKKVDSKWEGELSEGVLSGCEFKPDKIPYVSSHNYHPDFKTGDIYIEAKGRFEDSAEAKKYIWVRDSLDLHEELVFLFYNPKTPMPRANFRWYTAETILELLNETEEE